MLSKDRRADKQTSTNKDLTTFLIKILLDILVNPHGLLFFAMIIINLLRLFVNVLKLNFNFN